MKAFMDESTTKMFDKIWQISNVTEELKGMPACHEDHNTDQNVAYNL